MAIVVPRGMVQFVTAVELNRRMAQDGAVAVLVFFPDGQLYGVTQVSLVGPQRVRVTGSFNRPGFRPGRATRAQFEVSAQTPIPILIEGLP